jgi:endo-1,4-beta-D-glucanase Y
MRLNDVFVESATLNPTRRQLLRAVPAAAIVAAGRSTHRAIATDSSPMRPFPYRAGYTKGSIGPSNRSQDELDDDVRAAYDRWTSNYLVEAGSDDQGNPLARVAFGKPGTPNHDITVSEGQGYGMVIVAHLAGHDPDAQAEFDALWRFARAHPSDIDNRLMGWHIPIEEGNDSAFDGDNDMAYALLLADAQWGSTGEIDYRAAALELLDGMLESTVGQESRYPLLGDWVDPEGDQYNQWTTRPSDFVLGHFRAYERATGLPAWGDVVSACQSVIETIQTNESLETGLLPDFVQPVSPADHTPRPADPNFLEDVTDGSYGYNAGRTPWRIGTDALLNGDATSIDQVFRLSHWAEETCDGDPESFLAGYHLDGTPSEGSDYFTTFFVAPLGVAAMLDPDQQAWLDAIYDSVYDVTEDYYEDSVTLLSMLVMTGAFWDPTQ